MGYQLNRGVAGISENRWLEPMRMRGRQRMRLGGGDSENIHPDLIWHNLSDELQSS